MMYFPKDLIKPIALKALSYIPLEEHGQTTTYAKQAEWELVLEDALWKMGNFQIEMPNDVRSEVMSLDPDFLACYARGKLAANLESSL